MAHNYSESRLRLCLVFVYVMLRAPAIYALVKELKTSNLLVEVYTPIPQSVPFK